MTDPTAPVVPGLQFAFEIHADVNAPLTTGPGTNGERKHIVITGGTLRGPLRAAFHREVDLVPLAPLLHGGMLRATPDALHLGPAGWDLADGVIRAVLGALRPTGP